MGEDIGRPDGQFQDAGELALLERGANFGRERGRRGEVDPFGIEPGEFRVDRLERSVREPGLQSRSLDLALALGGELERLHRSPGLKGLPGPGEQVLGGGRRHPVLPGPNDEALEARDRARDVLGARPEDLLFERPGGVHRPGELAILDVALERLDPRAHRRRRESQELRLPEGILDALHAPLGVLDEAARLGELGSGVLDPVRHPERHGEGDPSAGFREDARERAQVDPRATGHLEVVLHGLEILFEHRPQGPDEPLMGVEREREDLGGRGWSGLAPGLADLYLEVIHGYPEPPRVGDHLVALRERPLGLRGLRRPIEPLLEPIELCAHAVEIGGPQRAPRLLDALLEPGRVAPGLLDLEQPFLGLREPGGEFARGIEGPSRLGVDGAPGPVGLDEAPLHEILVTSLEALREPVLGDPELLELNEVELRERERLLRARALHVHGRLEELPGGTGTTDEIPHVEDLLDLVGLLEEL